MKNTLSFYFVPSPFGLDWSSPYALLQTTLRNQFTPLNRKIGHVAIELTGCEEFFTGMRDITKTERFFQLLIKNLGLGILFHRFKGRLETKSELTLEKIQWMQSGRGSFLNILINDDAAKRLAQYLKEYEEKNVGSGYGLSLSPLHQEGAGCSAFAASFLELAGIQEEEFQKNWTRSFLVPKSLMNRSIPFIFLSKLSRSWASENEPHLPIFFWDPDLMHQWCMRKINNEKKNPSRDVKLILGSKMPGIEIDRTKAPTPTGGFWKKK